MSDRRLTSYLHSLLKGDEQELQRTVAREALRNGVDISQDPHFQKLSEQIRTNIRVCMRYPRLFENSTPLRVGSLNELAKDIDEGDLELFIAQDLKPLEITGREFEALDSRWHPFIRSIHCHTKLDWDYFSREVDRLIHDNSGAFREDPVAYYRAYQSLFPALASITCENTYSLSTHRWNFPNITPEQVAEAEENGSLLKRLRIDAQRITLTTENTSIEHPLVSLCPKHLEIWHNELSRYLSSDPDLSALEKLTLHLTGSLTPDLSAFRHLRAIDLKGLSSQQGIDVFTQMIDWPNLRSITIDSWTLERLPDALLAELQVESLEVVGTHGDWYSKLQVLKSLQKLRIEGGRNCNLEALAVLQGMNVEELELFYCLDLTFDHFKLIANCPSLSVLKFNRIDIRDDELEALSRGLPHLSEIHISGCFEFTKPQLEAFRRERPEVNVYDDLDSEFSS